MLGNLGAFNKEKELNENIQLFKKSSISSARNFFNSTSS